MPLCTPVTLRFMGLLQQARTGHLIFFVGAGGSLGFGLPTGAELAGLFRERLTRIGIDTSGIPEGDLLELADFAARDGGLLNLQQLAVTLADFTGVQPTATHRALALCILEGVATVMTTNWDDCIERAAPSNTAIKVAASSTDIAGANTANPLLKVHGCATKPSTLLITTQQLQEPPAWASGVVSAGLSEATVVFVGIGDVARYLQARIGQLVSDLGSAEAIRVVAPDIRSNWTTSQWAEVVGDLPEEAKIDLEAGVFFDEILRLWVNDGLAKLHDRAAASGWPGLDQLTTALVDSLKKNTAERVLRWARASHHSNLVGSPSINNDSARRGILALAKSAAGHVELVLDERGVIDADGRKIALHMANDSVAGIRAAEAARSRIETLRMFGSVQPTEQVDVICSGHLGPLEPKVTAELVDDVVAEPDDGDLLDGVRAGPIRLLAADHVLEDGAA